MNFENSFTVAVPAAKVWDAMMDFERVAPCMPGAQVTERTADDQYKVQVRVKVGPMSMVYRGQAEITDRDDAARTAAMRVRARETRGQGTANATVQIELAEEDTGTRATMATELKLSGRAAAMGRGVITDVSRALVSEFAENLARMLSSGDGQAAAAHGEEQAAAAVAPQAAGAPPEAAAPPEATAPPDATAPPAPTAPPPGAQSEAAASPQAPSPPPTSPSPPAKDALDAGHLARGIVASRLREPRTLLAAGGLVGVACVAVGYRLGRRAGRR
jgi:carbon monoxide dehydrogenase subunit G